MIQSPDGTRTEHFGFIQAMGTNNIAELTAAIESLRKIPVEEAVVLCSDSFASAITGALSGLTYTGRALPDASATCS
ncbi:hypothetical protein [Acidithiobacillus ferriphilus]|uniref:hypothetical protein n=1 Tax=Acidithiobacillus ferriphilus TaxID=1689834 RepID=UPI001E3FF7C8|nr:hypothetical protein [Acidithiobacillus ferriphilus]MEB8603696.1 hypothetical protein [Acidithiobacillus ferriphilus]